jgi:predicted CopG family antitoxin
MGYRKVYIHACMYICMTKVISLSDNAYMELKKIKNGMSFSEIVIILAKMKRKDSIMDFAGALDKKEGEKMKKEIMNERKMDSWRMK